MMDLNKLSKEELITLVENLIEDRGANQEQLEEMEEEHLRNEAFMESHERIDYGYGYGVYGSI